MTEMKRIAKKSDVWNLIQKGELIRLHLDFETTALERDFAQITSYGDAVGDIAGNFIDTTELFIKRPDRYLPTLESSLVTRTFPDDLDNESRLPHRIGMGKIADRIGNAAKMIVDLGLPEKNIHYKTVRRIGGENYPGKNESVNGRRETVLEYPLVGDDGRVTHDVRYHPDRNIVAYRFSDDPKSPYYESIENNYYVDESDGSKWKMVEPRISVRGYRIKWADMYWLRTNLVRAGFHPSNIFFTHSKATITNKQQPKNFAVDTYSVVQAVHLHGPQGEAGLKIGERTDVRTGLRVPTAKLEKVMEENTRLDNQQRGIRGGVLMPDGSVYNAASAHNSPAYDAMADFSIYNYCADVAPHIVKMTDLQADEQELRRYLSGTDPTKSYPPIFVMPRNTFPHAPTSDVVAFLGFDDQLGQLRRVLMPRLDVDLRSYRYAGKKLLEMGAEDIVQMMKEQNGIGGHTRHSDPLIRFESMRRWPGAVSLDDSLSMAGHKNWDREQIFESYQFLKENPDLCERMRRAAEILNFETHKRVEPANPMMEEQATRGGFGDLDYLRAEAEAEKYTSRGRAMSNRGSVPPFSEMIFEKARDIYNYHNSIDEILHRLALQPHPIDWCGDYDKEIIANFKDLVIRARRRLNKKNCPYTQNVFNLFFDTDGRFKVIRAEQFRDVRWKLMKRFLEDDEKERTKKSSQYGQGLFDYKHTENGRVLFANLSRDFRVVDYKGRKLDTDYLKEQYGRHPHIVQKKFEKGEWRIQFYRLSSEPSITATLFQFADSGKLDEVSPVWRTRYAALRNLYLNGSPSEDPTEARWQSIPAIERTLKGIEINAQADMPEGLARNFSQFAKGQADIFAKTDEGQRIIAAFHPYLEAIKAKYQLTPSQRQMLHFDPQSSIAYDRIEHEIPAENVVVIDIPDPHLRRPLTDIRFAPYSLVTGKLSDEQKRRIEAGVPVILRGEQTGRFYYGGPVSLRVIPKVPNVTTGFENYFEQAKRAYEDDAGVKFPAKEDINILLIQKPVPIANTRPAGVDASMQAIKVPKLHFDGLVAPRLAHFNDKKPLTGLVMPVQYSMQKLEEGKPIRFREMDASMGAKLTAEEGKETGHIYESPKLHKVTRMKVSDLYEKVSSGEISDTQAQACGFGGAFDMYEKVNEAFLTFEVPDPGEKEIYLLEFEPVNIKSWAYFNPPEAPEAAITFKGEPVPPSAYRWTNNTTAANDTVAPANRRGRRNPKLNNG